MTKDDSSDDDSSMRSRCRGRGERLDQLPPVTLTWAAARAAARATMARRGWRAATAVLDALLRRCHGHGMVVGAAPPATSSFSLLLSAQPPPRPLLGTVPFLVNDHWLHRFS